MRVRSRGGGPRPRHRAPQRTRHVRGNAPPLSAQVTKESRSNKGKVCQKYVQCRGGQSRSTPGSRELARTLRDGEEELANALAVVVGRWRGAGTSLAPDVHASRCLVPCAALLLYPLLSSPLLLYPLLSSSLLSSAVLSSALPSSALLRPLCSAWAPATYP